MVLVGILDRIIVQTGEYFEKRAAMAEIGMYTNMGK